MVEGGGHGGRGVVGDVGGHAAGGVGFDAACRNVYLHYVFDLWVHQWRRRRARGEVIVVRFADDFVVGFEHRDDAVRFWAELRERFASFGLELHEDKTRLIEFGRFAAERRRARGLSKPETFDFLGFTHICGKQRKTGRLALKRITIKKRLRAKLRKVKTELTQRRHLPIPEQGEWLASVCAGTAITTPCPATFTRSRRSTSRQSSTGTGRFGAAASAQA